MCHITRTDRDGKKASGVSESVLGERRKNKLGEALVTKQMLAEKDIQALSFYDDEFKEADFGKLGNPVQISGPVENKTKDENAREQSSKQMLNKLREVQVTKQMLAVKDIQVDQTKEKIHGNKVLSYYNDESEEEDSGKLGNPVQLSGPDENKTKDESAREQATKAMLTCLVEYRLVAGSLPPSQKEEVNIECNRVEQWLNDLSQQNLSNKNINPIRWSSIIKNTPWNHLKAIKAKIKWAVEGDENSGFFHGIINKRRNIQNIRGVMVDGNWIENPNDVKKEFFDHFANRFGKPDKPTASISLDFPNQISHEQSDHMEREVSNDEIKKSVWECGTDKAPGPDGFTFGFFRHFWHLVDRDVCEAVRYFFKFSDLPKGCNSSFIALIPKIPDANLVKDFRPISLIGSIYKIIAKILTNRLVDVLGGIINEVQSAFIKDRQILDGPFILNEVMSWCKKKKKQTLLFKV
ncbi:putative RNA-directed DNA polymerase, eukaryota, reverse transcriptase zinc-binding domain protein, partial [Tanacetum coccineum]